MSGVFLTATHEWVRFEGEIAAVGLTGAGLKGDVVYIELPEIGRRVLKGGVCASVETVKAVNEVHAPLDGFVEEVNDGVFDDPDMISRSPMDTWLFKLRVSGAGRKELLSESQYAELKRTE